MRKGLYGQIFLILFFMLMFACAKSGRSDQAQVSGNSAAQVGNISSSNGVSNLSAPVQSSVDTNQSNTVVSSTPTTNAATVTASSPVTDSSTIVSSSTTTGSSTTTASTATGTDSSTATATATASLATGSVDVKMNADNGYVYSISTDDTVAGTQIGAGDPNGPYYWASTDEYNTTLTPGVKNYIHIMVSNAGGPAGFIGSFVITGGFKFENNTQTLSSNLTAGLHGNMTGFGSSDLALTDLGVNGQGPWGYMGSQLSDAHWIWAGPVSDNAVIYLSIPVLPQ